MPGINFEETCSADLFLELRTVIKSDEFAVGCEFEERLSDMFPTQVGDHGRVEEENGFFSILFGDDSSIFKNFLIISDGLVYLTFFHLVQNDDVNSLLTFIYIFAKFDHATQTHEMFNILPAFVRHYHSIKSLQKKLLL